MSEGAEKMPSAEAVTPGSGDQVPPEEGASEPAAAAAASGSGTATNGDQAQPQPSATAVPSGEQVAERTASQPATAPPSGSSSGQGARRSARQDEDPQYGGCEGPDATYVKLRSSDNHEFIVKREHALTSGTIRNMLSGPGQFKENETNEVTFKEIPSHVLQMVCMYFTYKVRYTNSSTEIPDFQIDPKVALELLMAANFLYC